MRGGIGWGEAEESLSLYEQDLEGEQQPTPVKQQGDREIPAGHEARKDALPAGHEARKDALPDIHKTSR